MMKLYNVMSDRRHKEESEPEVDWSSGVPQATGAPPAPAFISLLETDNLDEAEARYKEADEDDVNDRIMLVRRKPYKVMQSNFEI